MSQQTQQNFFLTVPEVAALLRMEPGTIYRKICKKKIPYIKIGAGRVLFERDEILKWIKQQGITKTK